MKVALEIRQKRFGTSENNGRIYLQHFPKDKSPIQDYDFSNLFMHNGKGLSMFKVVMPIKRKAGMSKAEFEAYYENNHRLIEKIFARLCA